MILKSCPVCQSLDLDVLYPEYQGTCITSDYAVIRQTALANRCCRSCGLIFNAGGPRGNTATFYRNSYGLMLKKDESAIQTFTGPQAMSQAEKSLRVLMQFSSVPESGKVLEIGAGKGEFIGHFLRERPAWDVVALEPSAAVEGLRKALPRGRVVRGGYLDYQATNNSFDLVIALGVLEHVENPFDMLSKVYEALKPFSIFFLRVPNFARNPNDLFCADHLSKLTVHSLRELAHAAGFKVVDELEDGVPIYMCLRKAGEPWIGRLANAHEENAALAASNASVAKASMQAVLEAREAAQSRNERFGIFGMGASGLFAPLYAGFDAAEIAAYIDDNRTIWGTEVHGRPVGGVHLIGELGIRHVALAVSPVYVQKIREKLAPLGVTVYAGA